MHGHAILARQQAADDAAAAAVAPLVAEGRSAVQHLGGSRARGVASAISWLRGDGRSHVAAAALRQAQDVEQQPLRGGAAVGRRGGEARFIYPRRIIAVQAESAGRIGRVVAKIPGISISKLRVERLELDNLPGKGDFYRGFEARIRAGHDNIDRRAERRAAAAPPRLHPKGLAGLDIEQHDRCADVAQVGAGEIAIPVVFRISHVGRCAYPHIVAPADGGIAAVDRQHRRQQGLLGLQLDRRAAGIAFAILDSQAIGAGQQPQQVAGRRACAPLIGIRGRPIDSLSEDLARGVRRAFRPRQGKEDIDLPFPHGDELEALGGAACRRRHRQLHQVVALVGIGVLRVGQGARRAVAELPEVTGAGGQRDRGKDDGLLGVHRVGADVERRVGRRRHRDGDARARREAVAHISLRKYLRRRRDIRQA